MADKIKRQSTKGHRDSALLSQSLLKALAQVLNPTILLKWRRRGDPGFSNGFAFTPGFEFLQWDSKKKGGTSRIATSDMKEIRYGQKTDKFQRKKRPLLQHLSFSIIYESDSSKNVMDTLDLACKDDTEYLAWTQAIDALICKTVPAETLKSIKPAEGASAGRRDPEELMRIAFQQTNDVVAFGWGEWGQLGNGRMDNEGSVARIKALLGKGVKAIGCGWAHAIVLLDTNDVWQYGNRMGTGFTVDYSRPTLKAFPEKKTIVDVACGDLHTMAITDDGHLYTWGTNDLYQLGHGDDVDQQEPKVVQSLVDAEIVVVQVAGGFNSSACVDNEGSLYTWGCGSYGCLGHGDEEHQKVPKEVSDLSNSGVMMVACGYHHMLAMTEKQVFTWGWNSCGQLGIGRDQNVNRPTAVEILKGSTPREVAAGPAHSACVVSTLVEGTGQTHKMLYMWGSNASGQLGVKSESEKVSKPLHIVYLTSSEIEPETVGCGAGHTAFISTKGELYTAGDNSHKQLGRQNTKQQSGFGKVENICLDNSRSLGVSGNVTSVLVPRKWIEDSEVMQCMDCGVKFSLAVRRHHCRKCGGIFCAQCSKNRCPILAYGFMEPVRVCDSCHTSITRNAVRI